MYPAELVKPMREDLTRIGFTELFTADEVDDAIHQPPLWLSIRFVVVLQPMRVQEREFPYKMLKRQTDWSRYLQE